MISQMRFDVHDAATKAETLAYNLENASGLASMLCEALEKEVGNTIEGQSLLALVALLDSLQKDCEGLSGDLYALHRGMSAKAATGKAAATDESAYEGWSPWPSSK